MRFFTSGRLVIASASILLAALLFTGCSNGMLSGILSKEESTTAATTVTTTQPTTVATTQPTEPAPVGFDHVAQPDQHGERRSPNVKYFVPYSQRVGASYFNDAVFIGDSVSMSLSFYNMATSCFGEAVFLTSGSLSAGNALWSIDDPKSVHPTFRGQKVSLADGVAMSGKKKVYLMLGVNELGWVSAAECLESLKKVVDTILAKSPDVQFYMQSITPISFNTSKLNMALVNEYNALLSELCRERGWYYLDVASVFKSETGYLIPEYCSDLHDMGIHFNNDACKIWADYLYTHVPVTLPAQQTYVQQLQPQVTYAPPTQVIETIPVVVHTIVVQVPEATTAPQTTKPKYTLPADFTMPEKESSTETLIEEGVME